MEEKKEIRANQVRKYAERKAKKNAAQKTERRERATEQEGANARRS